MFDRELLVTITSSIHVGCTELNLGWGRALTVRASLPGVESAAHRACIQGAIFFGLIPMSGCHLWHFHPKPHWIFEWRPQKKSTTLYYSLWHPLFIRCLYFARTAQIAPGSFPWPLLGPVYGMVGRIVQQHRTWYSILGRYRAVSPVTYSVGLCFSICHPLLEPIFMYPALKLPALRILQRSTIQWIRVSICSQFVLLACQRSGCHGQVSFWTLP